MLLNVIGSKKIVSEGSKGHNNHRSASAPAIKKNKVGKAQSTLAQRVEVLDWHERNGCNQSKTARHFAAIYPELNIKQPLVSEWVRDKTKIREHHRAGHTGSRKNTAEHPQVDEALQAWVQQAIIAGLTITGDVIRAKWYEFAKLFKISEEDWLALSEGWLTRFKTRNGLRHIRKHGEAGSVRSDTVAAERQRLREITNLYHPRDIWNMDETGLFYG